MSRELIGDCGYIVGERGYFERINKESGLSDIIHFSPSYHYYDGIRDFCDNISSVISDLYSDAKNNAKVMSFIDERDRQETINIVEGLNEICKMWSRSSSDADRAVSILSLSASETKLKSGYRISEIEKAAKKVKSGSYSGVSGSEKIRLVEKAISSSVIKAADGDSNKLAFLLDIEQGRGDNYLSDVLKKYEYDDSSRRYTGRNGKEMCSREYNSNILNEVFGNSSLGSSSYGYSKRYADTLEKQLGRIYKEIEDDINKGIRNRDYVLDSNGETLKTAIDQLEKVGLSCYGLKREVDVLMWFVGGNKGDILRLQGHLNSLRISGSRGSLKEDGVYGSETLSAWNEFCSLIVKGSVPTLVWTKPLQSDLTHINLNFKETSIGNFLWLGYDGSETRLLRLDKHPYKKDGKRINEYYHFNVGAMSDALERQKKLAKKIDHGEITKDAYNLLKNFDSTAKIIRVSGKTLLVTNVIAETISLGQAVYSDLQDADRKIGKSTYREIARISGSWAGSAAGAKVGAMVGAAAGTAVLPGLGTAVGGTMGALILGVTGSFGGEALGKYIVDISCLD